MNILITGCRGFVGKNLCESLRNIKDGKNRKPGYASLFPLSLYEYSHNMPREELESYCNDADFVFHLAGVNRPVDEDDFIDGNVEFTSFLLEMLEMHNNACPVVLASSIQASLQGRYADSAYGRSKLASEELVRRHSRKTGAPALIYRFPNIYGKWCRPNYNSVIATFCSNIANDLPIVVNDINTVLELLYIDDLVSSLIDCLLESYEPFQGSDSFCSATPVDFVSLGQIVDALYSFKSCRETLEIPQLKNGSFQKKLYSTYLSYLSPSDLTYGLPTKTDARGSFTEFLRIPNRGQISINVTAPGEIKGNHWHHSKWEKFVVVSGRGVVEQRRIGLDPDGNPYPVFYYELSADNPTVVETPPGFTHNLINLSNDIDLVTVIWANEIFDPDDPDTFYEEV